MPAHQAPTGEGDHPVPARSGDRLLPAPGRAGEPDAGGRKIRSILPLFTSYLFLYGDQRSRIEGLKRNALVQVLPVPDQAGLDRDLRRIHRLLASGLPVVPEPTYPVGTRIRITNGPLAGLVGVVVRREKRDHFVAVVQFLGRGAAVALQDWQVKPA